MIEKIEIKTNGEAFYSIAEQVQSFFKKMNAQSGILHLFVMHTSCALTISEDYDPSAKRDLEKFLKNVAPRNAPFILAPL